MTGRVTLVASRSDHAVADAHRDAAEPLSGRARVSYLYRMRKQAISVTLETDNLAWLRGRARAADRSVSETLDLLVTAARGDRSAGDARSVAGTISIAPHDPELTGADAVVRSLFGASLARDAAGPARDASPRRPRRARG
jgi:hypothetical protein